MFFCRLWAPVFEVKQRWAPFFPGFVGNLYRFSDMLAGFFRNFAHIFRNFAQIFRDFSRIFDKSKLWTPATCTPAPCTTVEKGRPS